MEVKYKIGDLVTLNGFGRLVIDENRIRIGLIIGGPRKFVYPLTPYPEEDIYCFLSYDIMMGGELINDVPQEFLISLKEIKTIGDK